MPSGAAFNAAALKLRTDHASDIMMMEVPVGGVFSERNYKSQLT